jgi:hypothetical protein
MAAYFSDRDESKAFQENVNSWVVRGLRCRTRRPCFTAKIQISAKLFAFLRSEYGLNYRLAPNDSFLDDFRIVRAHFVNNRDYARADHFKFAIRKSRQITYGSFRNGRLHHRQFSPSPYFVVNFFRNNQILRLNRRR